MFLEIEIHLDTEVQDNLRNIQCNIVKIMNHVTHRYNGYFFKSTYQEQNWFLFNLNT